MRQHERHAATPVAVFLAILASTLSARELESDITAGDSPAEIRRPRAQGPSLGVQIRERWEWSDPSPVHATRNSGAGWTGFHRVLTHAELPHTLLHPFIELSVHGESKGEAATQNAFVRNGLDIQHAFVDIDGLHEELRLRLGRQELVYEFIGWRDAPNVRRAWDGMRATWTPNGWTHDLFALRLVEPQTGSFDDDSHASDRAIGVHTTSPTNAPYSVSAFAYDTKQSAWRLADRSVAARTRTAGGILTLRPAPFELSVGGALQYGKAGSREIRSWYAEAEIGRTLLPSNDSPYIAVRASAFSGGSPAAAVVHTFDPLFPNFAYSSEAALQSPSNLVRAALIGEIGSKQRTLLEYRGEGLWRYSQRDAYYLPAGSMPIAGDDRSGRWVGLQQQLKLSYPLGDVVRLVAAYVNLQAGSFLQRAGHGDAHYLLLQLELGL